MAPLRALVLSVTCLAGQASQQHSSETVSVLLATLQELQAETTANKRGAGEMVAWCADASHQRTGLLGSLRRQLQESAVAMQQVKSVSQQLDDEKNLASTARQDKEKRLADAVAIAQSVEEDYEEEKSQLEALSEATHEAIRLMRQQMQQGGGATQASSQAVSQLMQLTADKLTDDEKAVMDSVAGDDPSSTAKPQALLQVLASLVDRLAKEQQDAATDHEAVHTKLFSFTDHMNSSILDLDSQLAATAVERAHRSRESAVLQSKTAELTRLAKAAEASRDVAKAACRSEAERARESSDIVTGELTAVRALLQLLPSGGSDLLGVADAAPSFLQTRARPAPLVGAARELRALAKEFPDEAAWYVVAAGRLGAQDAVSLVQVPQLPRSHGAKVVRAAKKPKAPTASEDPLAAIAAFAGRPGGQAAVEATGGAEAPASLGDVEAPKQVQSLYRSLGQQLLGKQKVISELGSWCVSVTRDAKMDAEATGRARQRTAAKLQLAKVSALMSERDAGYFQGQQEALAKQMSQLILLIEEEGNEYQRSSAAVKDISERLLQLVTEIGGEDATAEERKAADGVRAFVEQLDGHADRLQAWHDAFHKTGAQVSEADRYTQQRLVADTRRNQRRLTQFKAEAQLLMSLDSAKAYDHSLSDRYEKRAQAICSSDRVKSMGQKQQELQREMAALQTSLTSGGLA